jgi:hypothetical protein
MPAVERVPGKVSGAWLFKGSRVPVEPSSKTSMTAPASTISSRGFRAWIETRSKPSSRITRVFAELTALSPWAFSVACRATGRSPIYPPHRYRIV